jgi:polysaccharide pyruvyl transferase CsaB
MGSGGNRPVKRVGISGSYGGLNMGDEAILKVIITQLRRAYPVEITVFSRDAEDTRKRHEVEQAVAARELSRREAAEIVRGLDLFILGGGGILYDAEAEIYLREVNLAHEVGTPVMVYAVSAGPLLDPGNRAKVRQALNQAAVITVRDRQSLQLFEEIGVTREIHLTADPAVLSEPEALSQDEIMQFESFDPKARLIGLSVRELGPAAPDLDVEHYHRLVANVADYFIDRLDAEVVFFPLERRRYDVQHSHGVVARMSHAQRASVLKRDYTPGQLISLLGRFQFAVGMRLHFLVFAALAGIPMVGLPYATKVTGFLEGLRTEAIGLGHVSAGQLIARIDRAWGTREELRLRIREALGGLKQRALENNALAVGLLTGNSR